MKTVAADTFGIERSGNGVVVRHQIVAAVKRRVETRNLREVRRTGREGPDRRQIVRLMQRRERYIAVEPRQYVRIDDNRLIKLRPAVNDPMPDGGRIDLEIIAQPRSAQPQPR